jgi:hypothetical protein
MSQQIGEIKSTFATGQPPCRRKEEKDFDKGQEPHLGSSPS